LLDLDDEKRRDDPAVLPFVERADLGETTHDDPPGSAPAAIPGRAAIIDEGSAKR